MSGLVRGVGCRVAGRGFGVRQGLESRKVAQQEQEVPEDRPSHGALADRRWPRRPSRAGRGGGGRAGGRAADRVRLHLGARGRHRARRPDPAASGHAGPSLDAVTHPGRQAARTYTVRTGDTLSGIAQHFYGHASDWQWLYHLNQAKISDPNLIYTGQVFSAPADPPASVRNGTYQARHARAAAATSTVDSQSSASQPRPPVPAAARQPARPGSSSSGSSRTAARRPPARPPATACRARGRPAGWSRPTTRRSSTS